MVSAPLERQQGLQTHHNSKKYIQREHLAVYSMSLPFPQNQQQRPSTAKQVSQKIIPHCQRDSHEDYEAGIVFAISRVIMIDLKHNIEQYPKEDIPRNVKIAEILYLFGICTHQ